MPSQVIGVRFREASRMYHFAPPKHEIFVGEYVVVETPRGLEMGHVVTVPDPPVEDETPGEVPADVKPIVRMATGDDRDQALRNQDQALIMLRRARELAVTHKLDLYLVGFQINLSASEATGYFHAEAHVNFRDLIHDLEDEFGLRVEMQHAGPRDRAKLVDGYDLCGQRLCCASWMTDFPKVGVRMAKEQNLALNPDKISGVCGRLLCCLTFEFDAYKEMRGTLPKMGKRVSTPAGMGKVVSLNTLAQKVTIFLEEQHQRVEVPAEEIGLAVRVEEAPNQALIEERESRGPAGRRRSRSDRLPPSAEAPSIEAPTNDSGSSNATPVRDATAPAQRDGEGRRRRRRRRRRRGSGDAEALSDTGRSDDLGGGRSEGRRNPPDSGSDLPLQGRPAGRRVEGRDTDGASDGGSADAGTRRTRRRRRRRKRRGEGGDRGGSDSGRSNTGSSAAGESN